MQLSAFPRLDGAPACRCAHHIQNQRQRQQAVKGKRDEAAQQRAGTVSGFGNGHQDGHIKPGYCNDVHKDEITFDDNLAMSGFRRA